MIRSAWTHRQPGGLALDGRCETGLVDRAMQVIAVEACQGLRVQHLADRLGVSRRCLAKWFPRVVGCSPHEAIQRAVFDRVEGLLLGTDLRLSEVAEKAGFRHVEYLTVAFTRRYGVPPRDWRRQRRVPLDATR